MQPRATRQPRLKLFCTGCVLFLLAGVLSACSGGFPSGPPKTEPGVTLETISIAPNPGSVAVGGTVPFIATGHFSDGSSHNITANSTWSSSNTSIATIVSTTGVAKGIAAGGPVTITAMDSGVSGTASLTVTAAAPPTLRTISVTPNPGSVAVGSTVPFTATGHYSDGSTQNITTASTWSSSNTSIATIVSTTGVAKGIAAGGPITITAMDSGVSGTASLTVTAAAPPTLQTISVTPNPGSVAVGSTLPFTATGHYSDGSTQNITTASTWSSSNMSIATIVSTTGVAKGIAAGGPITITAMDSGVSGTASLTVTAAAPPTLQTISVTPNPGSVAVGSTLPFTATGHYSDGSTQNLTTASTWSSSNMAIATIVSNTGVAKGIAAGGPITITAMDSGVSGTASLTVTAGAPPTLQTISVTPNPGSVAVGSTLPFTATGHYSDGSTQNLTTASTWSSSNMAIATIVSNTGVAKGIAAGGPITITAMDSGVSGTASLTVTAGAPPTLQTISVTPNPGSVAVGSTVPFTATGHYSDGSTQNITTASTWSSSNTAIATIVSNTGVAKGIAAGGPITITAMDSGVSGTASLTVTAAAPPTLQTISVTPNPGSVAVESTLPFTATGHYSDGSTQNITTSSAWSSSNTAIATIVSSTGVATGVAPGGPITITAMDSGVSGTANLSVAAAWIFTGSMTSPRAAHTATMLNNGKVLIVGGANLLTTDQSTAVTTAELYNPSTGTFSLTGNPNVPRLGHTATLLNDGRVLIVGGSSLGGFNGALDSAEIYDPATGMFSVISGLHTGRILFTATLLKNGMVLVAGGQDAEQVEISSAELFDPSTDSFTVTGDMTVPRGGHVATLLPDGTVLVAGGVSRQNTITSENALASAEIYNPSTSTFTAVAASMTAARALPSATFLDNGTVLIAGGANQLNGGTSTTFLTSAEIYNPTNQSFTATSGNMAVGRALFTATPLTNGTVLVAGGLISVTNHPTVFVTTTDAELFDPTTGTFSVTTPLNSGRTYFQATLLANGTVLATGGITNQSSAQPAATLSSAEFYEPFSLTPAGLQSIAVTPGSPSIAPSGSQQFVATGTFSGGSTQVLNSVIWSSSNATVATMTNDISNSGTAVGVSTGTTTITATVGAVSGTTLLTVATPVPTLQSITVTPNPTSVAAGSTLSFTATGNFSDGSTQNLTAQAAWRSSNTGFATINSTTGVASGVSAGGPLTITATFSGVSGTAALTVTASGAATLQSITVSPNPGNVAVASTLPFAATGHYSDGSTQNITSQVNWTSSNTSLATINVNSGVATGVAFGGPLSITAEFSGITGSAAMSVTGSNSWTFTGAMNSARENCLATLLNNGMVLIVGGGDETAELYDPLSGIFTLTGTTNGPRNNDTATLLKNGMVLIAGGEEAGTSLSLAELYNPATGMFSVTGSLNVARQNHTATLLPDGTVLITGGETGNSDNLVDLNSAELYDPANGTFTLTTGSMTTVRSSHMAALLNDGTVLIAGGEAPSGTVNNATLSSAETYDPATQLFSAISASLTTPREAASTALLNGGTVLIAGGFQYPTSSLASAELYDPTSQTFTATTGSMTIARTPAENEPIPATLLTNGTVLFEGGETPNTNSPLATAEIYDPVAQTFTATASMNEARDGNTATRLIDGSVLAAGGDGVLPGDSSNTTLATAELYEPSSLTPPGLLSITVTPASPSISVGATQSFIATGTFTGGTTQTLSSVTWSTSNAAVATISNDSTNKGAAVGVAAGMVVITATAGTVSGTATLTVN